MKNETNPLVFKEKLAEFKHSKQLTIDIYTNGSKDGNKVAAAVVNNDIFSVRLPYEARLFTAQARAIELSSI